MFISTTLDEILYIFGPNLEEAYTLLKVALDDIEDEFDQLIITVISFIIYIEQTLWDLLRAMAIVNFRLHDHLEDAQDCRLNILTYLSTLASLMEGDQLCLAFDDTTPGLCLQVQQVIDEGINRTQGLIIPEVTSITSDLPGVKDIEKYFKMMGTRHMDEKLAFGYLNHILDNLITALRVYIDDLVVSIKDTVASTFTKWRNSTLSLQNRAKFDLDLYVVFVPLLCAILAVILTFLLIRILYWIFLTKNIKSPSKATSNISYCKLGLLIICIPSFLVTTGVFSFGTLSENIVCKTMEDPDQSQLFQFISPLLSDFMGDIYENNSVHLDFGDIVNNIHNNAPIYQVLKIFYWFDIQRLYQWKTMIDIDGYIDYLEILFDRLKSFVASSKQTLMNAAKEIDPVIYGTFELLENQPGLQLNITMTNMTWIQSILPRYTTTPEMALALEEMETNLEDVKLTIEELIYNIENHIKSDYMMTEEFLLPSKNLTFKTSELFFVIQEAIYFLQDPNGCMALFVKSNLPKLFGIVDNFVTFVIDSVGQEIGRTWPLSNIYNATQDHLCHGIVTHVNAGKIREQSVN